MPHQCVRCAKTYDDGSKEILTGCTCGSRFFFFMKKKDAGVVQEAAAKLSKEDVAQMEKDAFDLVGEDKQEKPIVLDLESIRMDKPGKFEINLIDIFRGKPLVYKLADGKYIIDVVSTFEALNKQGGK